MQLAGCMQVISDINPIHTTPCDWPLAYFLIKVVSTTPTLDGEQVTDCSATCQQFVVFSNQFDVHGYHTIIVPLLRLNYTITQQLSMVKAT
jgi:hypothetical protein